jgi:DNA modification methylase
MVGDSTLENDYQKLMAGKQADCILTDPPYNVNYQGGTKEKLTIQNDAMTDEHFAQFLKSAYNRMFDSAKPGAAIYVFHSDTGGGIFRKALIESGFYLKQCLIWVKDTFVMSRQDYHWQHEPILYGWKPGAAHKWFGRRIRSTVLDDGKDPSTLSKAELVEIVAELQEMSTIQRADKPHKNDKHPTMKPVPLVAQLMSYSSEPGDIVLDPFCGSGTTLIAAEQLGRSCYAIEKDPRYADVIIERWEKITGQQATVEN